MIAKLLGGLSGILFLGGMVSFLILRYKLQKARTAVEKRNAKIIELNEIIEDHAHAVKALEGDLAAERQAAAHAVEKLRELRDALSDCRAPSAVRRSLGELLEELQAPDHSDGGQ